MSNPHQKLSRSEYDNVWQSLERFAQSLVNHAEIKDANQVFAIMEELDIVRAKLKNHYIGEELSRQELKGLIPKDQHYIECRNRNNGIKPIIIEMPGGKQLQTQFVSQSLNRNMTVLTQDGYRFVVDLKSRRVYQNGVLQKNYKWIKS